MSPFLCGTRNALDLLEAARPELPPAVVVFGSQRYLQSLVIDHLTGTRRGPSAGDPEGGGESGGGADPAGFPVLLDGLKCGWADLADQLNSHSLFGDEGKLVVLRDADEFVKNHRERLEEFLGGRQPGDVPLILVVSSWPAGTRLYKQTEKSGLQIHCDVPSVRSGRSASPDATRVGKWLVSRAAGVHGFGIEPDAARLLFDLCDGDFGRADQELARLGLYVAAGSTANRKQVQDIVGGWRSQTMFEAIDAAVEGQAAVALLLIDRLVLAGEHPLALFGQLAWSLRRYAQALRILDGMSGGGRKASLAEALKQAGFSSFRGDLDRAEPRMRRLGRGRVGQLSRVLLEIDGSLKGSHSREDRGRLALEKLVFWLA